MGYGLKKYTFLQRKHTNSQKVYEKMLNATNHSGFVWLLLRCNTWCSFHTKEVLYKGELCWVPLTFDNYWHRQPRKPNPTMDHCHWILENILSFLCLCWSIRPDSKSSPIDWLKVALKPHPSCQGSGRYFLFTSLQRSKKDLFSQYAHTMDFSNRKG